MIRIFADTTSNIAPEDARKLGIYYIPQIIIFGEETYRDDSEIDHATFLRRMKAGPVLPKTAAPPPALYTPIFSELVGQGDTIIVLAPSSELSGTYRSAFVAAEDFPGADIRVIDTKLVAGGLGMLVIQAKKWADSGMGADELVENVMEMASRHRVYFLVATLEYLYRGGRIGAAKALFGSLLQVKPILFLDNGQIGVFESQRTHKRAVARLKEVILSDCPRDPEAHLCLMQGDAADLTQALASELGGQLGIPVEDIPIYDLTPAILVHGGPGVIGISYYVEKGQ